MNKLDYVLFLFLYYFSNASLWVIPGNKPKILLPNPQNHDLDHHRHQLRLNKRIFLPLGVLYQIKIVINILQRKYQVSHSVSKIDSLIHSTSMYTHPDRHQFWEGKLEKSFIVYFHIRILHIESQLTGYHRVAWKWVCQIIQHYLVDIHYKY